MPAVGSEPTPPHSSIFCLFEASTDSSCAVNMVSPFSDYSVSHTSLHFQLLFSWLLSVPGVKNDSRVFP